MRDRAARSHPSGKKFVRINGVSEGVERDYDEKEEKLLEGGVHYPRSAPNLTPLQHPFWLSASFSLIARTWSWRVWGIVIETGEQNVASRHMHKWSHMRHARGRPKDKAEIQTDESHEVVYMNR